jgi:hypothetical protein
MLVAEPNHRALKYVEPSAVMMFGILPANHNARVAKSQAELVVAMKMTVQLAHRASTTTKHRPAHHARVVKMRRQVVPVVMTHQPVVQHVLIEKKHLPAHRASTTMTHRHALHAHAVMMHHQVVLVAMTLHRLVRHVHIKMKHLPALHVNTTTMLQFAHLALSAKKFMHRSLVCHAKRFRLNA